MEGQIEGALGRTPGITSSTGHQDATPLSSQADPSLECVITNPGEGLGNDGTSGKSVSNDDVGELQKIKQVHLGTDEQKIDIAREMAEAGNTHVQTSGSLQDIADLDKDVTEEGQNTPEDGTYSKSETSQEVTITSEDKIDSTNVKNTEENNYRHLATVDISVGLSDAQDTYVDVPFGIGKPLTCLEIDAAKTDCQADIESGEILRDILEGKKNRELSNNAHLIENQQIIDGSDPSQSRLRSMLADPTKSTLNTEHIGETFDNSTFSRKPVSQTESDVQHRVVNVYIVWNDGQTGEQSILKWNHPNCNDCRDKYNDLKHHVHEKHNVEEVKNSNIEVDGTVLNRLAVDLGKKSQVVVKTETLGNTVEIEPKSCLNVSVPHLVNLASRMRKTQKKGRKRADLTKPKKVPVGIKKHDSKLEVKEEVLDSENDDVDTMEMDSAGAVPNKRKRGRPKRVREEPKEPNPSDTDHSDDGDPDYQPYEQVNKKEQQLKKGCGHPKKSAASVAKKEYVCTHDGCDMVFNKLRERTNHEKEAHAEQFVCEFEGCGIVFKTANQKVKHKVDKHDGVFECEHCDLTFKEKREYIAHSTIHVSFKCDYENCGKSFATEHYLKAHKKNQHMAKTHICPVCQKAHVSKRHLNRHMKTHQEKTLKCDYCPKLFKSKFAVEKHMRLHTGEGLLVCQFCGKKLNGKPSLDRHERVHKGEKPYKCKYCEKAFVCQNSLDNHEQEHTGKQFVCDVCGKKCKSKGNLKEHQRSHTDERPFKCDVCGKAYGTASVLWTHKTSKHLGFKKYECDICGKQFARYHGLSKHRTVHTGVRRYECKFCHKMFTTSDIRRGHYKQVHLGIKRRGHQGKAKRLNDEAKRLTEAKELLSGDITSMEHINEGKVAEIGQSDISSSSFSHDIKAITSQILATQEPVSGRSMSGLHPSLIPIDFSRERKQGIIPHSVPLDPSRSDFQTMVDSFIQFSKKH